jgi:FkbM family methyltransferase
MSYPESTSCGEIGKILHIILENILPFKTNGTFIEIGANDGKTGSFTYNLASIGWNGLNFEPIPRLYEKCCENHKNHKNVKNFQIGLGESSYETKIIDANTLSAIDPVTINTYSNTEEFASYFKDNNNYHIIKIEKLDTILEETNTNNIDIVVLDVEGYEENVLKGFTIDKYKPTIVIIEICDEHPNFKKNKSMMDKCKKLRQYFKEHNYYLIINDIVDNIYVHEDTYKTIDKSFINNIKKLIKFPQYYD